MTVLWVFRGGGLGSAARYLIGQWAAAALGVAFPYGTLIVNLAGCFALGLVVQLAIAGSWHGDVARGARRRIPRRLHDVFELQSGDADAACERRDRRRRVECRDDAGWRISGRRVGFNGRPLPDSP